MRRKTDDVRQRQMWMKLAEQWAAAARQSRKRHCSNVTRRERMSPTNIKGLLGTKRIGTSLMATLALIYEEHAEECLRTAARMDDPERRDLMLKLASAWRKDAKH